MRKYQLKLSFIFFLFILLCSTKVNAQEFGSDTIAMWIPEKKLFLSHEVLQVKIFFDDLKELKRDVSDDNKYHHALLSVINEYGEEELFEVKVKTRGNFRKSSANCNFPPLLVNFDRDRVDSTVFESQNKLKLVTHCNTNNREFEQYVIQEYLVYRLYNILTDKSFRVRLAQIEYIDMADDMKSLTRYGFFIEDVDDMAGRNGCKNVKMKNIPLDYTDYFYQSLVSVFQYMIGNTDWSVPYTHNIKLLMEKPDLRPIPVPYDFDWCGMVNPVYAVPSHKLGIKTVEERLYRGYERPLGDFRMIFDFILSLEDEIYSLYETAPLSKSQKDRSTWYLDEFFRIIRNDDLVRQEFIIPSRKIDKDSYYGK